MSQAGASIFNPMSAASRAVTLGPRAFLREIIIAGLLSLSLPLISIAAYCIYLQNPGVDIVGLAIGVVTMSAVTAIPLIVYASLRLNAATLARERAVFGASGQRIYEPLEGPVLMRNTIVAGSIRSRFLSGFPTVIGFSIQAALMWYAVTGIAFTFVHIPLAIILAIQVVIAADLLR